jgi:hypothetical protein
MNNIKLHIGIGTNNMVDDLDSCGTVVTR